MIDFYSSADLKEWRFESRLPGFYECPELVELPVDGGPETRWIVFAADGEYVLGAFDGRVFRPDHEGKHRLWYGNFYASQLYSDAPDGRRVQIGWARGNDYPGMPFNQGMTVPVDLSLRQHEGRPAPLRRAGPGAEGAAGRAPSRFPRPRCRRGTTRWPASRRTSSRSTPRSSSTTRWS